jgi:hypothetical protein
MKLKWRILRFAVCFCVLLTSVYAIGNVLIGRSVTGNGEGLMLVKPAFAQSGDASFLEQEAGISAYANLGQSINLNEAKKTFRTIEKQTEEYVIGSVSLPDYPVSEDVHLYVRQDGWIFAYYMNTESTSKIIDWLGYSPGKIPTKLELGLQTVSNSLGLSVNDVKYYHFKYPDTNRLVIAIKSDGIFKLTVPSSLLVYSRSWSHDIKKNDGSHLTRIGDLTTGQLRSDVQHEINVFQSNSWYPDSIMNIDGVPIDTFNHSYDFSPPHSAAITLLFRE